MSSMQSAQAAYTVRLVESLAQHVTGQEHVPADLLRKCVRTLGRVSSVGSELESVVRSKIRQRLAAGPGQKGADGLATAVEFDQLYQKLVQSECKNRFAFLLLFDALSDSKHDVPALAMSMQLPRPAAAGEQEQKSRATASATGTRRSTADRKPLRARAVASVVGTAAARVNDKFLLLNRETELELVRELLYVFQGIDGKRIRYVEDTGEYAIDPALRLHSSVKDMLLQMCELGWLYRQVQNYTKHAEQVDQSGRVGQAFCHALQDELNDYYRLLAVLETQLTQELNELAPAGGPNGEDSSEENEAHGLTLMRLFVWVHDPIERMRLMASVVDGASRLKGGALASAVHAHTRHGDPFVNRFVQRVMGSLCSPIFQMIGRWVFAGQLEDPHKEFFVQCKEGVADDQMWHDRYVVNERMQPKFISPELAHQILVIGKSINFLRLCCDDAAAPKLLLQAGSESFEDLLQGLQYGNHLQLQNLVREIARITDERLLQTMLGKYQLRTHLLALKKFMLLGQGDFVTCLMDMLGSELKKRASQLYLHNLTGMLEGALRSSNAQYEDQAVLDRVGVRLLEASPGDSGWEVFALDYAVGSPLTAVVHNAAMVKYRTIFHMLWRVKRVEWGLVSSWRTNMTALHARIEAWLPALRLIIHQCTLQRSRMLHFITNLSSYMMFEVLETTWVNLIEKLGEAERLDDVIAAHDAYLDELIVKSLLAENVKALREQLFRVLDIIIRFCALQDQLIGDAHAEATRRRALQTRVSQQTATTIEGVSRDVLGRVQDCIEDYDRSFRKLIGMLKEQTGSNEELRYLTFRLDFNEFYANPVPVETVTQAAPAQRPTARPQPADTSSGAGGSGGAPSGPSGGNGAATARSSSQARGGSLAASRSAPSTSAQQRAAASGAVAAAAGAGGAQAAQLRSTRSRVGVSQRLAAAPSAGTTAAPPAAAASSSASSPAAPMTPPRASATKEGEAMGTPAAYLPKLSDDDLSSLGGLDSIHMLTSTNLTFDSSGLMRRSPSPSP